MSRNETIISFVVSNKVYVFCQRDGIPIVYPSRGDANNMLAEIWHCSKTQKASQSLCVMSVMLDFRIHGRIPEIASRKPFTMDFGALSIHGQPVIRGGLRWHTSGRIPNFWIRY